MDLTKSRQRLPRAIGDRVLYGTDGVYEITDIREETIAGIRRRYYLLKGTTDRNGTLVYVPTDNAELVGAMRDLMSKEEAEALIGRSGAIPATAWEEDSRRRNERFRAMTESGDRDQLISLIKTVHLSDLRRRREGKKAYRADEIAMKKAERLLCSELACVLNVEEEEIARRMDLFAEEG